jgi:hypothetical protein
MELLVLHIPGLSARLLRDQMAAAVEIARVGGEGTAATLVTIDGASPTQQEAALLTGMLPEYLGAFAGGVGDPRPTRRQTASWPAGMHLDSAGDRRRSRKMSRNSASGALAPQFPKECPRQLVVGRRAP